MPSEMTQPGSWSFYRMKRLVPFAMEPIQMAAGQAMAFVIGLEIIAWALRLTMLV